MAKTFKNKKKKILSIGIWNSEIHYIFFFSLSLYKIQFPFHHNHRHHQLFHLGNKIEPKKKQSIRWINVLNIYFFFCFPNIPMTRISFNLLLFIQTCTHTINSLWYLSFIHSFMQTNERYIWRSNKTFID